MSVVQHTRRETGDGRTLKAGSRPRPGFEGMSVTRVFCLVACVIAAMLPLYADPGRKPREGDVFSEASFSADFSVRRDAYIALVSKSRPRNAYTEMIRMAAGGQPDEETIVSSLDEIDHRVDCADFRMNGIIRLLYQFGNDPRLAAATLERVRQSVIGFKYWPDEPGVDSMCTWSENHQILFMTSGYLAGQLHPDKMFTNSGRTGREQMARFRPRIERWLDFRFRTGFSEWLSNVYYDEDLAALLNLADFCEDETLRRRAAMVTDLLLMDIALNSHRGVFGSTHGRTYEDERKYAECENTTDVAKLAFGCGLFTDGGSMSASCLALSPRYRMPAVLYAIANDRGRAEVINRQRAGIRGFDAEKWGLDLNSLEDGMVMLSLEAYMHPRTMDLFVRMLDAYGWWDNEFFKPFRKYAGIIRAARRLHVLPVISYLFRRDLTRNTREQVNIYTYRTPDYMLSTAQDYRPGYGGDQQHIWQATLGPGAVCFTSHPAGKSRHTPSYWDGYGTLPRAGQAGNVLIEIYNVSTRPGLYVTNKYIFTHAWFPRDQFDEVIERRPWVFARKGDGYLALYSRLPYMWSGRQAEDAGREMLVPGKRNTWICEMGRRETDGDFPDFVERIANAKVEIGPLHVVYHSPTQGRLEFGWKGPLTQDGRVVELGGYPRYGNPYADVPFPADKARFDCAGDWLELDWAAALRNASRLVEQTGNE